MLKAEIIAVGTELLLGQIANTNAQFISQKMAEIGVPVYYHVAVGDNETRLREVIKQAQKRSNIIIFTGGLGPTKDDLTKEVAADVLNKKMVLDEMSYKKINHFFEQRQIKMTENNKKQAIVFEGSTVFPNEYGLAPGIGFEDNQKLYVFLPGPPSEMKPMMSNEVISWLAAKNEQKTFYSVVMRFIGIGESALEEEIVDLIDSQSNPTIAPLAKEGEVTIRLTAHGKDYNEALSYIMPIEKEIHRRLNKYHYSNGEHSIEETVYNLLKENNLTISMAESCTGGRISMSLTSIPGSSQVYHGGVICYTNKVKQNVLQVPKEILDDYGAVSYEAAKILAENTLKIFNTDMALSITGVAGPDSIENKPVGLIYIGISEKGKDTIVQELHLSGNRSNIQHRASKFTFYYLWERLKERL